MTFATVSGCPRLIYLGQMKREEIKMQRLSAWFYLKNNKKRAAILILSFGLYFALLYSVQFFMYPTTYMYEAVAVKGAERIQMAYLNGLSDMNEKFDLGMDMSLWEPKREAAYEELVAEINKGTDKLERVLEEEGTAAHVFVCDDYQIGINSFGGTSVYNAPMLRKEELDTFVSYLELEVVEGRLPEEPGEFIMDANMAKNRGFTVGSQLFDEETRLVGIVEYDTYIAAGIDFLEQEYPERTLYLLSDGNIPDLKEYFARFGVEADSGSSNTVQILSDKVNMVNSVEKFAKELQNPLKVMTYSIAFVLGLTVFFVYRLHVQDRYSEWCLYRSLGYSQREVYALALREFGICLGFSVVLAGVITILLCIVGGVAMHAKGMLFEYWLPEVLLQILGIGTLLAGVLQIPVVIAMGKVRTIDAMEAE